MKTINIILSAIIVLLMIYALSCNNINTNPQGGGQEAVEQVEKKKDGIWEGNLIIYRSGEVYKNTIIYGKITNSFLVSGNFNDSIFNFNPAIPVTDKYIRANYKGDSLVIYLHTYKGDSLIVPKSQMEVIDIKIQNGKRAGKLYIDINEAKQTSSVDCECNVYNSKINSLTVINSYGEKEEPIFFNPPVALEQYKAKIAYKNFPSRIELKYYESEMSNYKGSTSNSESTVNSNQDDKNDICPKCGKKEKYAAIYWCSKCQSLKCPRCGDNVRTHIFKKLCSECERKGKFN
jgi:hypothetical protein